MSRPKNPNKPKMRVAVTRVPRETQIYLKVISNMGRYRTLKVMHTKMLLAFIREEPWKKVGLEWRETKNVVVRTTGPDGKGGFEPTGWDQINIELPEDVVDDLESLAIANGVSVASALYTAIYWWTNYVNPKSTAFPKLGLSQTEFPFDGHPEINHATKVDREQSLVAAHSMPRIPSDSRVASPKRAERDLRGTELLMARLPDEMVAQIRRVKDGGGYGTLGNLHHAILSRFIDEKPWELEQFEWGQSKSIFNKQRVDYHPHAIPTGWCHASFTVKKELAEQIKSMSAAESVSVSSFIYTALQRWIDRLKQKIAGSIQPDRQTPSLADNNVLRTIAASQNALRADPEPTVTEPFVYLPEVDHAPGVARTRVRVRSR